MPIYCINLQHRQDRKKQSLHEFKKLGIPQHQVIYPPFKKDVRGGVYGCFDSHVKIWHDFYVQYPNDSYALIFEDDFVSPPDGMLWIKKAEQFICKHEGQVDLLHLHNLCVPVKHECNTKPFTNGYGLGCHAYFITRQYIERIVQNTHTFPEANGRHIDYELCINIKNKDNLLYTEKNFYLLQTGFMQHVGISDNMINSFEKKDDVMKRSSGIDDLMFFLILLRKYVVLTDVNTKKMVCLFYPVVCLS